MADWGSKPKPAELIRLLKTAESLGTTMRHMDARLCDTSTTSGKKPKTCHIVRHFIKVPQTMAWCDSQHRGWINYAGLGLEPQQRDTRLKIEFVLDPVHLQRDCGGSYGSSLGPAHVRFVQRLQ